MKNIQTFEEFLNENKSINEQDPDLTLEQNHIYVLMEYIIMHVDEDDFDTFIDRIDRKFKKNDYQWSYGDIEGKNLVDIKEMLKKYYIKEKLITDKFLKNPAKKWQDLIAAMKWLIA
jgi:hypothetical protein